MAVFHTEHAFVDREAPTRVGRHAAPAPDSQRVRVRDPEEEAIEIATRVVERFEVAKSLARLFAGVAREHAAVAGAGLKALADQKVAEIVAKDGGKLAARALQAQRFAKAAAAAAAHAATSAAERHGKARGEPAEAPAAAANDDAELDPETLRDDAC